MDHDLLAIVLALIFTVVLVAVMLLLVRWAKQRNRAAVTFGALMSVMAPDPTFEESVRTMAQTRQVREEDGEGEDW